MQSKLPISYSYYELRDFSISLRTLIRSPYVKAVRRPRQLKSGLVGFGPDVQGTLSGFTNTLNSKASAERILPADSLTALPIYLIVT
jgi:hypothetical protein